jgi:hypothetical protein
MPGCPHGSTPSSQDNAMRMQQLYGCSLQVKKRDIINLQMREETGFTWQKMVEAGYIE